ncbi:hypothetical protein ACUXV3_07265 [Roseobacteraceae bacterium NS-SX3]
MLQAWKAKRARRHLERRIPNPRSRQPEPFDSTWKRRALRRRVVGAAAVLLVAAAAGAAVLYMRNGETSATSPLPAEKPKVWSLMDSGSR